MITTKCRRANLGSWLVYKNRQCKKCDETTSWPVSAPSGEWVADCYIFVGSQNNKWHKPLLKWLVSFVGKDRLAKLTSRLNLIGRTTDSKVSKANNSFLYLKNFATLHKVENGGISLQKVRRKNVVPLSSASQTVISRTWKRTGAYWLALCAQPVAEWDRE